MATVPIFVDTEILLASVDEPEPEGEGNSRTELAFDMLARFRPSGVNKQNFRGQLCQPLRPKRRPGKPHPRSFH